MTHPIDLKTVNEMSQNTLATTLGMQIIVCEKDRVIITMPVDHRTHQPMGLLHGGASVALAETAASIGATVNAAESGKVAVGQEINANHLRPVKDGTVRAEAVPVMIGKTSQIWEIKIFHEETNKLVCISRCTLAVINPF